MPRTSHELLPIVIQENNHYVDARLLHKRLQSKQEFSTWIKNLLDDYLFKEGEDFLTTLSKTKGRPSKDYLLTFDTAKELGMLSRSEKGREIRQYFIAKEKELRGISQLPKEQAILKGLKCEKINGRRLYPYRETIGRMGYNTSSGSCSHRVHRYMGHFVKMGNMQFVSEEFAMHLYHQRRVMNNRQVMREMQPVLPFNFGEPLKLKGGLL